MAMVKFFFFFGLMFLSGASLVKSTKKRTSLDVEGNKSVTARLGNNVTLPCRFKMDRTIELSMLNVHWIKDGVTKYFSNKSCCNLPGYGISEKDLQNGLAPLQLVDVQEEDAGRYTCTIKYEAMEGNSTTRFYIEPTSLHVNGTESVTARPRDNVTLPCRFEMDREFELSELTIHWLKDEVTKYFSNKTCCNISGYGISEGDLHEGSAPLPLINVQEKDAGIYTCSIKYKAMEGSWITTLHIVKSTQEPTSLRINGTESVTARPGDNVTLPCRFEMDQVFELSELTVHWLKDEVTKSFSNKTCCNISGYGISEGDLQEGSAPLPLINVQEKDAGIYTCSIKYKAMEESWITTLHIGPSTTTGQPTSTSTGTMPPPVVPQYRTLKLGLILGALAVTGLVAAFVYICFKG